jgi:cytochrome c oxidase subunit 3
MFQVYEYFNAPFTISDSVYGSIFYLLTGFHGFHVVVGTIFLIVCFIRLLKNHFSRGHHIGLESSIWYWHFVDIVWLFLYIFVYWWGS